jgi:hypothetical protein
MNDPNNGTKPEPRPPGEATTANSGVHPSRVDTELYRHEGKEFVSIAASFRADGALEVTDCASGPCCKEFFGTGGVDAVVTVEPKDKDKLLVSLLKAKFGADKRAVSHFYEFLNAEKIPCSFIVWPDFD